MSHSFYNHLDWPIDMREEEGTILLVEDSDSDALLIEQAFRRARVMNRVVRASRAAEAIRYLEQNGSSREGDSFSVPVFVLLDLKLPDGTGYELLRWIRERKATAKLPVVVVSGSENPGEEAEAERIGANGFFKKNLRFENLVELVRSVGAYWTLKVGK